MSSFLLLLSERLSLLRAQWLVVLAVASLLVGCETQPERHPASAYLDEGEAALAVGDTDKAVAAYQIALAIDPGQPLALRGLLEAQIANQEAEAAFETLARIERSGPRPPSASSAELGPVDPCPTLAGVVAHRLERGAAGAAEEPARRSLSEQCTGAETRLAGVLDARGHAQLEAGRPGAAVASYREALEIDPSVPGRFVVVAELLLSEHDPEAAMALLAEGLERHPDDRSLRNLMVRALTIR